VSGVLSQLWGIHIPTSESGFYKTHHPITSEWTYVVYNIF
jgi:hypothetical protein